MQLEWAHQVMYVHDMATMLDFYTLVLGFEIQDRGPIPGREAEGELVFLSQVATDHHQLAFQPGREAPGPSNTVSHSAFRVGSLDDVKEMARRLEADGRADDLTPLSHGNAWSIYFRDPEGNRIEVFVDSPFAVGQPAAVPWSLDMTEAQLRQATIDQFGHQPDFGPIEDYYARRAEEAADRSRSERQRSHGSTAT